MKTWTVVVLGGMGAMGLVISSLVGPGRAAESSVQGPPAIAVVRVLEILRGQATGGERMKQVMAQQSEAKGELEQLAQQVNEQEQALRTFATGSDAYLEQLGRVMELRGRYEARQEFLERQITLKQQLWTQQAYDDVVRAASEVAKERGFGLVLAVDPNGLPMSDSLAGMIAMQKVVYSGGCPDLTDAVRARIAATQQP
jgi:hypothetical protein